MGYFTIAREKSPPSGRVRFAGSGKGVRGIAVGTVCAIILAACGSGSAGGGGDVIKFGAIVPSSGPFAEWGKGNTVALRMLQKQVNEDGGINGKKVEFVIYDDAADPAQSANLVRKLAENDEVLAIAGPLTSSSAEVAFPVANQLGITAVSQASSKPGVAAQNRPWAYRNTIDEGVLADATVREWRQRFNIDKAAVIYDSKDAVSTAIGTQVYPQILAEQGITVMNSDDPASFETGDVDVSAQVTQLKSLNPDGVVIGADYSQAITVIREMEKQGLTVPVVGGTPLISSAILKASDEIPIMAPATYYVGIQDKRAATFTGNLTDRLKKAGHTDLEPTMYDANIYEIGQMFIEAVRSEGLSGDMAQNRQMIRDYFKQMQSFKGLVGPISFNAEGDAKKSFFVVLAQQGRWTPQLACQSSAAEKCEQLSGSK